MISRTLEVELYGTTIGSLVDASDRRALLEWSPAAGERWGMNSPALSLGLRVGVSSAELTESFFGALLPEGEHIARLAREVKVDRGDLIGLLAKVGADLAGALRIRTMEPQEARDSAARDPEALDETRVAQLLHRADGFIVGGGGSALPGFQRKLTLTRTGGRWVFGNGIIPSTHILKPVEDEYRSAAEAEHYALALARETGLAPYESWVEEIGSHAVLVIERYDRARNAGDTIRRIHQEDAAQALGLPWGGNDKFEQNNPRASLRSLAALLDRDRSIFDTVPGDREKLLKYVTFTVTVGNTDAHAKNYSLLHREDGGITLAPIYDVAPLALAYGATTALSMAVNGVRQLPDVTAIDLATEGTAWGIPEGTARSIVDETLDQIVEATHRVTAHASVEAHVPGYVRGQARNLREGGPARIPSAIPLIFSKRIGTPQPRQ